jgi:DNA-binding SARP family transcriptional activator/tetratricopeptide (TPR) repeat protein
MTGYRLVTLGGLVLLDESGEVVPSLGPRNLALLAYLALATKPLSRDHVAELFWGDRDEDRARHSMREALSKLRQLLGPESIPLRSDRVTLGASVPLSVDARTLIAAFTAGDTKKVVELYGGPFLDGVHAGGSRSFEDWSDAERSMYESRFIAACVPECARLREAGAWTDCAELARRWLAAAPLDPKAALELLHALAAPGTRDALRIAAREYRQIVDRLATDFELTPHASVVRAADEIARRTLMSEADEAPIAVAALAVAPGGADSTRIATPMERTDQAVESDVNSAFEPHFAESHVPPDDSTTSHRWPSRQRRNRVVVAFGVVSVLVAALALSLRMRGHSRAADNGMLAIMPFDIVGQTGNAWLAAGAPRLIGASLSREHVVEVLEPARLRDVLPARDTNTAPSSADALAAARTLGARWLLTGSVIAGDGRYWLDVSLRDVRSGRDTRRVTTADTTLDAVIAQATARLVAAIDTSDSGAQLAELEPNTINAYRSYIRALRLRAQMRPAEAAAALDAAIASDSSFVAAVMERRYLLGATYTTARMDSARALDRAYLRGRAHATDFERLYFDAYLAMHSGDHVRAEALGRTLLARYPRDPRAYTRLIEMLSLHGHFTEAMTVAERAIALDSAGSTARSDACRVCVGYRVVSEIARTTGDLGRAEAAARRATVFGPEDPAAWAQLGAVLSARGRYDDAVAAARRAGAIAPMDPEFAMDVVRRLIEAREYVAADSALRVWESTDDPRFASTTADLRVLLMRERGQFNAAVRALDVGLRRYPSDSNWLLLVQGETRARAGDVAGSRRAFITAVPQEPMSIADGPASQFPADWARTFAWPRALLADALWQAGNRDTVRLATLADSIQAIGARSYYGRDWRLYHHVRGLIAMTGGRWAEAEREFGAARWGRFGWTRTLVELAHAQLAQGHATDAITSLRDAYASPLAAMGRYVPRSELDFEMERAFVAFGAPDSARVYAAYVTSAWRTADTRVRRRLSERPVDAAR